MGLANRKQAARARRARKTKRIIQHQNMNRLAVHKSLQHIYAQIIGPNGEVLASASTLDKELREANEQLGCNIASAEIVGKAIAQRALEKGVIKVAFDRAGFKYHGCVKALADAAREGGLEF